MADAVYGGTTGSGWGGDSLIGVHGTRYELCKTDSGVHDSPTFQRLDVPPPPPPIVTADPRGRFRVDGVRVARTHLAQSFPPVLASLVARLTV